MKKLSPSPPVAQLLPAQVRKELAQAAATVNTRSDPRARQKAIEEVTQRAKLYHPHLFKHTEF